MSLDPKQLKARGLEPLPKPGPMERLIDAQRAVGESRMLRTDADPTKLPEEACQAVRDRVRAYLKERGIRQHQVAKAIGVSGTVLSAVLAGTYAHATGKSIIMDLDRWLEQRQAADAEPKLADFVWTTVATEIRSVAKLAIRASHLGQDARIGLVYGDTGCGKTMALKAIAETEPGALYVCCDYYCTSPAGVLSKVARALKLDVDGLPSRGLFAACCRKLEGSARLLIVDEIHALLAARDDRAFHTLRHLHDQTGAPQLWCSTPDLIGDLRSREGRGREPLGQIRSRIGIQRNLMARTRPDGGGGGEPLFSVDEIIRIYSRNEMKLSREGGQYLASVANAPQMGGLRTVTNIVGAAVFTFKAAHPALTAELLRAMHRTLDDRGYDSVAAADQGGPAAPVAAKAG